MNYSRIVGLLAKALKAEGPEQKIALRMAKKYLNKLTDSELEVAIEEFCRHIICSEGEIKILQDLVEGRIKVAETLQESGMPHGSSSFFTDHRGDGGAEEVESSWAEHFEDEPYTLFEEIDELLELKTAVFNYEILPDTYDDVLDDRIIDLIIPQPKRPRIMKILIKRWLKKYFPHAVDYSIDIKGSRLRVSHELEEFHPYNELTEPVFEYFAEFTLRHGYESEIRSHYEIDLSPYHDSLVTPQGLAEVTAKEYQIPISDIYLTVKEFMDKYHITRFSILTQDPASN